ncbi:hypothetical protein GALL_254420 [mine drainage metagenome]|uniref:Uncharacterized protein n=1 Tax=mine drainage metagenome TaxID=410659 RepID=A0A1J5RT17_9ZZZZ
MMRFGGYVLRSYHHLSRLGRYLDALVLICGFGVSIKPEREKTGCRMVLYPKTLTEKKS